MQQSKRNFKWCKSSKVQLSETLIQRLSCLETDSRKQSLKNKEPVFPLIRGSIAFGKFSAEIFRDPLHKKQKIKQNKTKMEFDESNKMIEFFLQKRIKGEFKHFLMYKTLLIQLYLAFLPTTKTSKH